MPLLHIGDEKHQFYITNLSGQIIYEAKPFLLFNSNVLLDKRKSDFSLFILLFYSLVNPTPTRTIMSLELS